MIEQLAEKIREHFNVIPLKVAGRLIYYRGDIKAFILAVHSTGPEETKRAGEIALESLTKAGIIKELGEQGIGFAVQQI